MGDPSEPDIHALVIEPDLALRESCSASLRRAGISVLAVESGDVALEVLDSIEADVVVAETGPPGSVSASLLGELRAREPDVPVILMTAEPHVDTAILAVNLGVYRYLVKPVSAEELEDVVRRAALLRTLARVRHEAVAAVATEDPQLHSLSERYSRALERIWIEYQPIVSTAAWELVGFEALLRVNSDGFAGPEAIIAAAVRLDRTTEIGRAVRRLVANDVSRLPRGAQVFVNLVPSDLLDNDLSDPSAPLSEYAHRVVLELTERASLDAIPELSRRVSTLRGMGFRIALDDLGAGYSGLSSLTQLEPEIVKLDRSLIRGVHRSARRRAVVRSMVALCRSLDVSVIGEGVEWEAEAEALQRLDVRHLQGYLIAPPARSVEWPRAAVS